MQIFCCYENFCDKHIKEEIMKNFTCPNCKAAATLKDIVPNKKLREIISWFKELTNDNTINIQNQNSAGNQLINPFGSLNANYLNNLKGFVSAKPKEAGKEGSVAPPITTTSATTYQSLPVEPGKVILSKENLIEEKLQMLKNQTAAKTGLTPIAKEKESLSAQQNFNSDEKNKNAPNVNLKAINPNNLFSNHENNSFNNITGNVNIPSFHDSLAANANKSAKEIVTGVRRESLDNEKLKISDKFKSTEQINDINKIEFKKETNMTPEEKMQLYNKINSDSSVTGSIRKHSEDMHETTSQKGTTSK